MATDFDEPGEQAIRKRHEGSRVLLAEDNPVNEAVTTTLLELAGLQVDVAHNGIEVIDMANASRYDLVLMDVQMPLRNGLDAARLLRTDARTAHLPIIAMTASDDADDHAACLAAGMNDQLIKPVLPPVLYGVLARWLASSRVSAAVVIGPPAEALPALASIEGLDVASGLAFFAGDSGVYLRGLRQFAALYAGGVEAIDTTTIGADARQIDRLRRDLHSVAGASAAVGAIHLAQQAQALGNLLQQPGLADELVPALAQFSQALSGFVADLQDIDVLSASRTPP